MAYAVARPNGSFELRESRATDRGPRARTLATFRVLDDTAIEHVLARAAAPIDRASVIRAARRAGAPVDAGERAADAAARALIRECAAGRLPSRSLSAMVHQVMPPPPVMSDSVLAMAQWTGATLEERGAALRDLLLLADRLPLPKGERPRFPRLVPTP